MARDNPDDNLHVEFFMDTMEDKKASREAGRPIFRDVEKVRIKIPGDTKRVHVAYASEPSIMDKESGKHISYAERFPKHYEAFKAGQHDAVIGTPLSELPFLGRSKVAELKAMNIHTAEELAGVADGPNLKRLGMGAREWRDQARAWLDKAKGSADLSKYAAENAALSERLERMEEEMRALREGTSAPEPQEPMSGGADFENWADEDIKAFLQDANGARPKGNPSHETLVRMAREAVAAAKANEAA